jgi:uncharacterized protein YecE (DUF72 family)
MNTSIKIRIGCSGFYNAHWKKIFYPETLPKNQWLDFYGKQFNTLEINSTFYKFPTVATLNNWYQKTPDDFVFTVKAPKLITHLNRFTNCQELVDEFYTVCEQGLKDKLSCLLFQLPPTIVYTEEKLEQILQYLKPNFTNVLEFRHTSWWNNDVSKILAEHGLIFCSVNHPKMPNTIFGHTNKVYIRLHGNPEMFYSSYSTEFLTKLSQFILEKKELSEVFIYFNNTASTSGILNALELQQIIKSQINL